MIWAGWGAAVCSPNPFFYCQVGKYDLRGKRRNIFSIAHIRGAHEAVANIFGAAVADIFAAR